MPVNIIHSTTAELKPPSGKVGILWRKVASYAAKWITEILHSSQHRPSGFYFISLV